MIRRLLCLGIVSIATASPAATTRPATTQSSVEQLAAEKAREQQDYLSQIAADPVLKLPTGQITDIFTLTLEDGQIVITPKLAPTTSQVRCTVNGLVGPCTVGVFAEKNVPNGSISALQFAHRDFSSPLETFRHTMLFAYERSVQLSMDMDGVSHSKSASLIQEVKPENPDAAIRINAQILDSQSDDVIGQYNVSAANFQQLRQKYPRETQEFVVPILRDLQAQSILAPDARVAAQVLGVESKTDEALEKKIDAALAKFDSDDFHEREQAAKDLAALGQPAAVALRHADRKDWSIDRQSGVDAFLAQYKSMSDDQAQQLRAEPIFLLDCLYSSDPQTRRRAGQMLAKLTGTEVNPDLSGDKRDAQVDFLYARLFKPLATRPSTQR